MRLLVAGVALRGAAARDGLRVWTRGGLAASTALLDELLAAKAARDFMQYAPTEALDKAQRRRRKSWAIGRAT